MKSDGGVRTYRIALLAANTGGYCNIKKECKEAFHSTKCQAKLDKIGQTFQKLYLTHPKYDSDPENPHRNYHLFPYPINVTHDGILNPLNGWEVFPDSNDAPIQGKTMWYMPYWLLRTLERR